MKIEHSVSQNLLVRNPLDPIRGSFIELSAQNEKQILILTNTGLSTSVIGLTPTQLQELITTATAFLAKHKEVNGL